MKYLSDYMESAQTELFKRTQAFFAFSGEQFEKGKKENSISEDELLVDMGNGMICPRKNAQELQDGLADIYKDSIKKDIKENGVLNIIARELFNHECFYTGDWSDAVNKLADYPGITKDLVIETYRRLERAVG